MKTESAPTYRVAIYISGPMEVIKHTCRKYCLDVGLCVTIEPTTFIYSGGEETGAVIGLLNYPRFPTPPEVIDDHIRMLADRLLDRTLQHSVLIVTPRNTEWITKRDQ